MGNRFFSVTDPRDLETFLVPTDPRRMDRYARREDDRRRRKNSETRKQIEILRRALQVLPPRELDMLFATQINEGIQDKVRGRFNVQQSNISYHLERAEERVALYMLINSFFSETRLRALLYQVGAESLQVQVVLGFVKTENQSVTAKIVGAAHKQELTQGLARSTFFAVRDIVAASKNIDTKEKEKLLQLFVVVASNFNRLRAPKSQRRWHSKVGDTNYTSVDKLL